MSQQEPVVSAATAVGQQTEEMLRLQRLCVRIYGLFSRDLDEQVDGLIKATGTALGRAQRKEFAPALREELPVLLLIHALDRLEGDERLSAPGLNELVRGMLLPCFSLSYQHLDRRTIDPLAHVLERLDWYLDGGQAGLTGAFHYYAASLAGPGLADSEPMEAYLDGRLIPELDRRLETAFRAEWR